MQYIDNMNVNEKYISCIELKSADRSAKMFYLFTILQFVILSLWYICKYLLFKINKSYIMINSTSRM